MGFRIGVKIFGQKNPVGSGIKIKDGFRKRSHSRFQKAFVLVTKISKLP